MATIIKKIMQGYFIGPCQKVSHKFETTSLSKLIYSITLI